MGFAVKARNSNSHPEGVLNLVLAPLTQAHSEETVKVPSSDVPELRDIPVTALSHLRTPVPTYWVEQRMDGWMDKQMDKRMDAQPTNCIP